MSARELAEDLNLSAHTSRYADTLRLLQGLQRGADDLGVEIDELGSLTYSHVILTPANDEHDTDTLFTPQLGGAPVHGGQAHDDHLVGVAARGMARRRTAGPSVRAQCA